MKSLTSTSLRCGAAVLVALIASVGVATSMAAAVPPDDTTCYQSSPGSVGGGREVACDRLLYN